MLTKYKVVALRTTSQTVGTRLAKTAVLWLDTTNKVLAKFNTAVDECLLSKANYWTSIL